MQRYLSNILYQYPISAATELERCEIKNKHYLEYQELVDKQKIYCDFPRANNLYKYRKPLINQYILEVEKFIRNYFGNQDYYLFIDDDYHIRMSGELSTLICNKNKRKLSNYIIELYSYCKKNFLDFDYPEIYNKIKFLAVDIIHIKNISAIQTGWQKYAPDVITEISGRTTPRHIMAGSKLLRALISVPETMSYLIIDCKAADPFANAILSGDENFMDCFRDGDPYYNFAEKIGFTDDWSNKKRKQIKLFLNAVSNGMDLKKGIVDYLCVTDIFKYREIEECYTNQFSQLIDYLDKVSELGYVETPYHFSEIQKVRSGPAMWSQGVGSDILRLAHIRLDQYISTEGKSWVIAATLHDDVRVYCPSSEKKECGLLVEKIMRGAAESIFEEMGRPMNGLVLITDIEEYESGQVFEDESIRAVWAEMDRLFDAWVSGKALPQMARTIIDERLGGNVHRIKINKYIPHDEVLDLIREGAMRGIDTVLVAPPGSGKSTVIRQLVGELVNPVNDSYLPWPIASSPTGFGVIVTTSREGLCRQTHQRLTEALDRAAVKLYKRAAGACGPDRSAGAARVLVTTPNSLAGELGDACDLSRVRAVVVDELRLYQSDLLSKTMSGQIRWFKDKFCFLGKNIPHIFLDANFTSSDLDALVEWRGREPQVILIEQDISPVDIHYVTTNDLMWHIHNAASSGEKFVISTDELRNVDRINRLLMLNYPELKVLVVTGRNEDKYIAASVIADASKATNYDVVIYNHSVNVGWSIDSVAGIAAFKHTFALISHRFFAEDGVHQGICRNRDCRSIYISVDTRRKKDNAVDVEIIDIYNKAIGRNNKMEPGKFTDLSNKSALHYLFFRDEYRVHWHLYNEHEKIEVEYPVTAKNELAELLKQPIMMFLHKKDVSMAFLSIHRNTLSIDEKTKIINGLKIQSIYGILGIKPEYQDIIDEPTVFTALDKTRSSYVIRTARLKNPLSNKKLDEYISLSKSSFHRLSPAVALDKPTDDVLDDYYQYLRWSKDCLYSALYADFMDYAIGLDKFDDYITGRVAVPKRQRQKTDELKIDIGLRVDVENLVSKWIDEKESDIKKIHRITNNDQAIRSINAILRRVCGGVMVDRIRNRHNADLDICVLVVSSSFVKMWRENDWYIKLRK